MTPDNAPNLAATDGADLTPEQKAQIAFTKSLKERLIALTGQVPLEEQQPVNVLENLKPKVRKRVEVLKEIQSEHDELEAKFTEERDALKAKYQKLYEPLYSKRCKIVTGVVEVEGITQSGDEAPAEQKDTGVPDFWLNAMKNNKILADEIQSKDEEALKYLTDIKWCRIDDPKGFKLEFSFNTNPFFKNSVLTKIYHLCNDDDHFPEKAIGTEIEWYPGKCLTKSVVQKKLKIGSNNSKLITKTVNCESFFNFFSPPRLPKKHVAYDEATYELMNRDYDVRSIITDRIIPHAVSWFTGEVHAEKYAGTVLDTENDADEDDTENDADEDENEDSDEEMAGDAQYAEHTGSN